MTERIIITNGSVVTMNDAGEVIFDGAVVLEGDRITDVGPAADVLARQPADGARVIDATGKAVLPGLIDLHYHTALGKGWSDHLPLWEYLETCWYPIIRALDYDAAYWAALASYSESIKCGVTTVNDMYRQLHALADAAQEIGIRAVLSATLPMPSTAWTPWRTTRRRSRLSTARRTAGSRSTSASSGCRWRPRSCCAMPGCWPTTSAPASTST